MDWMESPCACACVRCTEGWRYDGGLTVRRTDGTTD